MIKEGDKLCGQTARKAEVIDAYIVDNLLGCTDFNVQIYTLMRKDGKTITGRIITKYTGDCKWVDVYEPLEIGQEVLAWWPDRRTRTYYPDIIRTNEN